MKKISKLIAIILLVFVLVLASGVGTVSADAVYMNPIKEEIVVGGLSEIDVTVQEGTYQVSVEGGYILENQMGLSDYSIDNKRATLKIPASGKGTFVVKSTDVGNMIVSLYDKSGAAKLKECSIPVKRMNVWINPEYTIRDNTIDVKGTVLDSSSTIYFFIQESGNSVSQLPGEYAKGMNWDVSLNKNDIVKYADSDTGLSTIYAVRLHEGAIPSWVKTTNDLENTKTVDGYASLSIDTNRAIATPTPTPNKYSYVDPMPTDSATPTPTPTPVTTESLQKEIEDLKKEIEELKTATPEPTQTPVPVSTMTTIKPTTKQTQKSPAPFVGLLLGLGAAAIFLRLRK